MKRLIPLVLALVLASCADQGPDFLMSPAVPEGASMRLQDGSVGPNDWIVVFDPGVADVPGLARALVAQAGGGLTHVYQHGLRGFAATLPPQAVDGIRNNPNVLRVEPDGVASIVTEVSAASWGLDRIDQNTLPLSGTYVFEGDGGGVDVYVIDTGIRTSHLDFEGRATRSVEADFLGGDGDDCHGHGTHVAGTVGGATYGVARAVDLIAVRVLDCGGSGAISGIIAGIDWVTGEHLATGGPSVANMSLGAWDPFGFYQSLNDAVSASVAAGVVYSVAAANDNRDACQYVPASAPEALTVGATDATDERASFSNFGSCLDLFAPGVAITSAFISTDDATQTWSGTSMAAPHVAGVAALYLGDNPSASAAVVGDEILGNTSDGLIGGAGAGSPNKLLFSLITGGEQPPDPDPTSPPTAPTSLTANAISPTEVELAWSDQSSDEGGFEVERSEDGASFSTIATVAQNVSSYTDTAAEPEVAYDYRVRAFNAAGPSGYSNVAQETTPAEPPPPSGTEVALVSPPFVFSSSDGKFSYWTAVVGVGTLENPLDGVEGAVVTGDWYREGQSSPLGSASGVTDAGGIVQIDGGRTRNHILYFCVTSVSGEGLIDASTYPSCSDSSGGDPPPDDPPDEPTDPVAPSDLTAQWSGRGGGRVELSWTPGGGADVEIIRNGSVIQVSSDNGKYNDRDGAVGDFYQVCAAGGDPSLCTSEVPVN